MLFIFSELFQLLYQLVEKRSKLVGLFGILILGYLAGSADPATTSDYDTYQMVYSNSNNGLYFERGYSYLSSFFFNRGWSYLDFRVLFCILASIILYIGVVRFTSNVAIFVFLYGITAFFIDATQVRNFMMVSLVILGSSFLIRLNLKNCMISVFFILLAAEFQSIGYVFLLIVLLRVLSKTLSPKAYKYSLVAVFALTAFIMLMVLMRA
ncbi:MULTISPECIES: hypothetical protein [unclassified Levilactobacillus]|uniref:hypothetical protein n=1 Tax=unclassified Levilactobacillus TaxID=2767918 RepID=UPI002FF23FA2